jgi:hypothetical protein
MPSLMAVFFNSLRKNEVKLLADDGIAKGANNI